MRPLELGRLDEGHALLDVNDKLGHCRLDESLLPVGELAKRVDPGDTVDLRAPLAIRHRPSDDE